FRLDQAKAAAPDSLRFPVLKFHTALRPLQLPHETCSRFVLPRQKFALQFQCQPRVSGSHRFSANNSAAGWTWKSIGCSTGIGVAMQMCFGLEQCWPAENPA